MIIYWIIVNIIGVLIFLFLIWRNLKQDYLPEQIFNYSTIVLFSMILFFFLSRMFLPNWWFWISFVGFCLGILLGYLRIKYNFYEYLEAFTIASIPWLAIIFITDSVINTSWESLVLGFITLSFFGIFYFFKKRYKSFSWYRSGRIGFASITTLGMYFLIRGLIAFILPDMLSFVGKYEAMVSGSASFLFFVMLYNLSRKNI